MFSRLEKEDFLPLAKRILEAGSGDAKRLSREIEDFVSKAQGDGFSGIAILEDAQAEIRLTTLGVLGSVDFDSELQKMGFVYALKDSASFDLKGLRFGVASYSVSHPDMELMMKARDECEDFLSRLVSGIAGVDALTPMIYRMPIYNRGLDIFRAYASYLHQMKIAEYDEVISSISNESRMLESLLFVFEEKFQPNKSLGDTAMIQVIEDLEGVIGRSKNPKAKTSAIMLLSVMNATVRTNFFCHNGGREYISMKIKSQTLPGAPKPDMFAEIFVYSPVFEGIHLRGGKVSRGGLRWSDRKGDFRTEVFALAKTQILKNTLIVPTGSKGGFVIKAENASKDFAVDCYKNFLRGMLDITDNIKGGSVVRPEDVVCFDENDPYLVVAADKGTASFSDYANEVSAEYGFWLGDAFASGGSNGYSHKDIGITAKGAWESAKQHFVSLGLDPLKDEFTAIGIGSMNGDVFGNGMIYSDKIKLLAAFSHQHIFIDPEPNPAISFEERGRLFVTPNSNWAMYDVSKLSKGGMIIDRSAKDVELSIEAKKLLGLPQDSGAIQPNEIIKKILTLPVDLFYSGGIGTFVKASAEKNADVGDSTNDAIRVDAVDVRARMLVEGANLSFSGAARVEYALSGGLCFGDFIDNVGGVNCSDREVNIKITLNKAAGLKIIKDEQVRSLMKSMEGEVANKVIQDSRVQSMAITRIFGIAGDARSKIGYLMTSFRNDSLLSEYIAALPGGASSGSGAIAGRGLTMPELSTLLSCRKINLFDRFVAAGSNLFANKVFDDVLEGYFPKLLLDELRSYVMSHELRREIICTVITNEFANYFSLTLLEEVMSLADCSVDEVLAAYAVLRKILRLEDILKYLLALQEGNAKGVPFYDAFNFVSESLKFGLAMLIRAGAGLNLFEEAVFLEDFFSRVGMGDVLSPVDRKALEAGSSFILSVEDASFVKIFEMMFCLEDIIACCFAGRKLDRSSSADFFSFYTQIKDALKIASPRGVVKDKNFDNFDDFAGMSKFAFETLLKRLDLARKVADNYRSKPDFLKKCDAVMNGAGFGSDFDRLAGASGADERLILNDFRNHMDYLLGDL